MKEIVHTPAYEMTPQEFFGMFMDESAHDTRLAVRAALLDVKDPVNQLKFIQGYGDYLNRHNNEELPENISDSEIRAYYSIFSEAIAYDVENGGRGFPGYNVGGVMNGWEQTLLQHKADIGEPISW